MNRLIALLLPLALTAAAAPPAKDWRTNVTETAAGWTFGKPGAPILTEYASFGCPHCGHFAAETGTKIDSLVKAGKLRFAFRPFLIFPQDRAGYVLARCVPAAKRLAYIEAVFADQAASRARLKDADANEAMRATLYNAELAGPVPHSAALAEVSGFKALTLAQGVTAAKADQCLANQAAHDWVTNADLSSRTAGVKGTPTYFWKGVQLGEDLTPESLLKVLPR